MKMEKFKNGFSVLEVVLVLFLMMSALGFSLLYGFNAPLRSDVNVQASQVVSTMRLLQSTARAGDSARPNSIHLDTNQYVTFFGSSYNPLASDNEVHELPATIEIKNISLQGGSTNVVFTSPFGETTQYGSFDLYAANIDKTISVTISQIGTVNF